MQAAIVADVHQKLNWKRILDQIETLDSIYFVGDYFDHHGDCEVSGQDAVDNFEEIMKLQESYPDKVFTCLGNHDSHYLPGIHAYSSYQGGQLAELISEALLKYSDNLNICYRFGKHVISHAGVTKTWYNNQLERVKENESKLSGYDIKLEGDPVLVINSWLQAYFKTLKEGLEYFNKKEDVPIELTGKIYFLASIFEFPKDCWDPYGDDVICPPVWVRPDSALADALFEYQIVGHTSTQSWFGKNLDPLYIKQKDASEDKINHIIFIDNDLHDNILYTREDDPVESVFQDKAEI